MRYKFKVEGISHLNNVLFVNMINGPDMKDLNVFMHCPIYHCECIHCNCEIYATWLMMIILYIQLSC